MSPFPTASIPLGPAAARAGAAAGWSPGPPTAMNRHPSNAGSRASRSISRPQRSAGQLRAGSVEIGAKASTGERSSPRIAQAARRAAASGNISGARVPAALIISETISTLGRPFSQRRL